MLGTKRNRTTVRLQDVALRLIAARGYDAVTVGDIAETAGVTPMTFYRHFASKELVVIDDPWDPHIADSVAGQPVEWTPLRRLRGGFNDAIGAIPEGDAADVRARVRIVAANPALRAFMVQRSAETERALVDTLVSTGTARLDAEIAVGACMGALVAALLDWGRSDDGSMANRIRYALDLLVGEK